jgi:hypothetical protein
VFDNGRNGKGGALTAGIAGVSVVFARLHVVIMSEIFGLVGPTRGIFKYPDTGFYPDFDRDLRPSARRERQRHNITKQNHILLNSRPKKTRIDSKKRRAVRK